MGETNGPERKRVIKVAGVEIWAYDKALGVGTWWDDGARVLVEDDSGRVVLSGNRAG